MRTLKTLTGAAVAIALVLVPSLHGQSTARAAGQDRRARELTILGGRGGELGLRITDAKAGGVQVEEVLPGGAAEKAGVKAGDVIVEFDGERVRSTRQLARLVQETPPGRAVKATLSRNGRTENVQITAEEGRDSTVLFDSDRGFAHFGGFERLRDLPFDFNFDFAMPGQASGGRLGVSVDELTNQLAGYFGVKDGVLVTEVADGSAASRAGVKAGDVITSVNGSAVHSREDLLSAVRRGADEELAIGIVRERKELTVKAKIDAPRRTGRAGRAV
jgi:serine protease Do